MRAPILPSHKSLIDTAKALPVSAREQITQPQAPPFLTDRRPTKRQRTAQTLLIDNYDSYTYNLFQLISRVTGETPTVIRNDELSWRALSKRLSHRDYQSVVISPGPGTPLQLSDIGICSLLLEEAESTPILGVCLGMQALAHVHGGQVVQAAEPIHGRLSQIRHNKNPLFSGIPSGCNGDFEVVRYHSLAVREEGLPSCLEPIAWTCGKHHAVNLTSNPAEFSGQNGDSDEGSQDGKILMGIKHKTRPHWGVQFHPESVATSYGDALVANFFACSEAHNSAFEFLLPGNGSRPSYPTGASLKLPRQFQKPSFPDTMTVPDSLNVRWRKLEGASDLCGGVEAIFWHRFGQDEAQDTFWLDSASMEGQRFSYMGGRGGPLWQRITFNLASPQFPKSALQPGVITVIDAAGEEHSYQTHFLDYLDKQLQGKGCSGSSSQLPFEFTGGFVGYLGYEMKAECGAPGTHASRHPDAAMFFADRLLAIDHATGDVYLVALHTQDESANNAAEVWLDETAASLMRLTDKLQPHNQDTRQTSEGQPKSKSPARGKNFGTGGNTGNKWQTIASPAGNLESRQSRQEYLDNVDTCLEALRTGESYELCLTTQLRKRADVSPRKLYNRLRASNPAAHSAWLSFGKDLPVICCSSPERFLKGSSDGSVEARPIKGTARRYLSPELDQESKATLVSSAKARAENLMIVDLLRNDLGRVCEVGSVHVPGLMEVESYSTVHNLVSTVRGMRKQGLSVVDCLRACFPGGSMTGAPKLRSMEILDRLEGGPRGVYSGCLGFIGLNNTFDLNIVIRTAVVSDGEVSIGAGGAIVLQSDPEEEYEEMMLKASALMNAIDSCAASDVQ